MSSVRSGALVNLRKLLVRPELGAFIAAVGIFILFAVVAGRQGFLSPEGTINYLQVSAELGILATAVSLLMIGGEFDLSIGSTIGFAGVVIGLGVTEFHLPLELSVLIAFVFAILIGYVNGLLLIRTRLPSFIVTLAFLFIL